MQVTADMILTDFGVNLPLDQRRREALARLTRIMAHAAGTRSAQVWAEKTWGLKDYEAKDLLKNNSSEAVWERIIKHPNGGWKIVLPVMGAVIGLSIEDYLDSQVQTELRSVAQERQELDAREQRSQQSWARVRALRSLDGGHLRLVSEEDGDAARKARARR